MATLKVISISTDITVNPTQQLKHFTQFIIREDLPAELTYNQNSLKLTFPEGTPENTFDTLFQHYRNYAPDTHFSFSINEDNCPVVTLDTAPPNPDHVVINVSPETHQEQESASALSWLSYTAKCAGLAAAVGMLSYSSIVFFISTSKAIGLISNEGEGFTSEEKHSALATFFATLIYNAEFFAAHGRKILFCCSRHKSKTKQD
jgi:hypothetical protein